MVTATVAHKYKFPRSCSEIWFMLKSIKTKKMNQLFRIDIPYKNYNVPFIVEKKTVSHKDKISLKIGRFIYQRIESPNSSTKRQSIRMSLDTAYFIKTENLLLKVL